MAEERIGKDASTEGPKTTRRRTIKSARVAVDPERASTPPQGPHAPKVTDRFDVHALLGEGGMGSVFVARDKRLGRVVALKVLRSELAHDVDLVRRFALEAQVGAQLEHPNIIPLYSLENAETGAPAFAMQLVEGATLADYMQEAAEAPPEQRKPNGPYALKKRLSGLLGTCNAIDFAHSRGVLHRDLKPDNIMLGEHHEVYVMDWGLARVATPGDAERDFVEVGQRPSIVALGHAPTVIAPEPPAAESGAGTDKRRPSFGAAPTVMGSSQATNGAAANGTAAHGAAPPSAAVPPSSGTAPFEAVAPGRTWAPSDSTSGARATQLGQVMGTFQYMAPEQAQGRNDDVGPAADQYALGLVLLELATLRPARSTSSSADAHADAVAGRTGTTEDVDGRQLDPALLAIVRRATATDISARYPTVAAFAEDVRCFVRDEPVSVYKDGFARTLARAAARRPLFYFGLLSAICTVGGLLIMGSLAVAARTAQQAATNLQGLQRVLVATQRRGQEIDVRLSDLAAGIASVGAIAIDARLRGPSGTEHPPESTSPLAYSPRYRNDISFARPLFDWPDKSRGAAPPASISALDATVPWMRKTLLASIPPSRAPRAGATPEATLAAELTALEAGRAEWLRVGVAFADGAFAFYPAIVLPPDYDMRARPWYRAGASASGLQWGTPVWSPRGRTLRLPVFMPLRNGKELLGVVIADMSADELAQRLLLDEPGFITAYLASPDGMVRVQTGLEAQLLHGVVDHTKPPDFPRVKDAELAKRMAAGVSGGSLEAGPRLVVFSRMLSPPWYYVAEFERAHYLSR
ncbi:MAG TPA: protein kinase [Polyangiaceae bacterium]|nr:protein kinase [Polyangiaceae bacterium]